MQISHHHKTISSTAPIAGPVAGPDSSMGLLQGTIKPHILALLPLRPEQVERVRKGDLANLHQDMQIKEMG